MVTLVLGGARSGKSELAERLVSGSASPVVYLATGVAEDEDMAVRIEAHRSRRPASWTTIETSSTSSAGGLVGAVRQSAGTVLLDSLATWIATAPGFVADMDGLCRALVERRGDSVVVSDEVGLGVHPSTESGRRFRDALGLANQAVAAIADEVLLVVAGRVLKMGPADR